MHAGDISYMNADAHFMLIHLHLSTLFYVILRHADFFYAAHGFALTPPKIAQFQTKTAYATQKQTRRPSFSIPNVPLNGAAI